MDTNETVDPNVPLDTTTDVDPVDTAEPADPAPADPIEPADPAAEPDKEKNKVQKRIDEITRARRQAENDAEYWRKVATGELPNPQTQISSVPQPQGDFIPPGYPAEPKLEAFEDYDQYNRALVRWEAGRIIAERDHRDNVGKAEEAKRTVLDGHAARVEAAKGKYDDWEEAFESAPQLSMSDVTYNTIVESDQSADISYYLVKNPDEVKRLNGLSQVQQIKEIARLEDKFKTATAPVKRITKAPTPLSPVGGNGTSVKSPDEMTDEEWLDHEHKRLAKLGRRY